MTIFSVACLALFSSVFPGVIATFPDMAKPIELRMNFDNIYISDQYSVFVYDAKTLKLEKKLCDKGEGPQQFRTHPRIAFTNGRLILYDAYKIIIYSKDFILQREKNLGFFMDRVTPIEDNFILTIVKTINNKAYKVFTLYNDKLEKVKDLSVEPENRDDYNYLINPYSRCRSWNDKAFIAQSQKGFYIEVFSKDGEMLNRINKRVEQVKFQEKHREAYLEELKYFLGRDRFEKVKARGVFSKPVRDYMPPIKNFWVLDDSIYVKTYDISETKEKYIVMDLKGNILKTLFLPKSKMELVTFVNKKFYYLEESENDEGWTLIEVDTASI